MNDAAAILRNLYADMRRMVDAARAFRATAVGTQNAGLITIQRLDGTVADAQSYARLAGFATADADELVCLETRGGGTVVLGKLQRAAPTLYTLDATLSATAGIINADVIFPSPTTQDASDTHTSSANSTYQNAMTTTITLPSGTFSINALFGLTMKRNPAGVALLRGTINGVAGGARSVNLDLNVYTTHWIWHHQDGIAGNQTISLVCQYTGGSGATLTSTIEPIVIPWIRRTA